MQSTQPRNQQVSINHESRIGIFGGAFDPPHGAHVALARAVIDAWQLTALHVLPAGDAWYKPRTLSPARDRLAMCELAFGAMARVVVDDRELRRAGPTYTIDTLRELAAQHPGALLVLQIGADQAAFFHRWRDAQEIARMACISIAVRSYQFASQNQKTVRAEHFDKPCTELVEVLSPNGCDESKWVSGEAAGAPFDPQHPLPGVDCDPARVRVLALPAMPHSATDIRRRAAQGLPIGDWVPPAVARYIAEHHLYQTTS